MADTASGQIHDEAPETGHDDSDVVLRTSGLAKRFGELAAVDDVDLSVTRGEFMSIIGPNGAGKTTLFNLISGALTPSAGSITLLGEDITDLSPADRVGRGLARSFQLTTIFDGLTVYENVRLAVQSATMGGMSPWTRLFSKPENHNEINERTEEVINRIGLRNQAETRADTLAYGDRRQLEIGIVLATDPEVVLLDEPTAGMSGDETEATIDLIEDVLAEKTLILVEHDVDLVMRVSDRITVLHNGRIIAVGDPEEIAGNTQVQEAYLGGYEQ